MAAAELRDTGVPIINIALKYGFPINRLLRGF